MHILRSMELHDMIQRKFPTFSCLRRDMPPIWQWCQSVLAHLQFYMSIIMGMGDLLFIFMGILMASYSLSLSLSGTWKQWSSTSEKSFMTPFHSGGNLDLGLPNDGDSFPLKWEPRSRASKWWARWERQHDTFFSIGCCNSNGSFWSSESLIYDALRSSDILFVTKTHESLVQPLSDIIGYHQFSTYR